MDHLSHITLLFTHPLSPHSRTPSTSKNLPYLHKMAGVDGPAIGIGERPLSPRPPPPSSPPNFPPRPPTRPSQACPCASRGNKASACAPSLPLFLSPLHIPGPVCSPLHKSTCKNVKLTTVPAPPRPSKTNVCWGRVVGWGVAWGLSGRGGCGCLG